MQNPYFLRPGEPAIRYTVFLSSADDALALRDRVEVMFREANNQLKEHGIPAILDIDRWENTVAQRAHGNEMFVQRARQSHLLVVLLLQEVRPGTREELDEVLKKTDTQIAVLWFDHPQHHASPEAQAVAKYLADNVSDQLFYQHTGDPSSDRAWLAVSRIALRCAIHAAASYDKTPLTPPVPSQRDAK